MIYPNHNIKTGDTVMWKGCFGTFPHVPATISRIERTSCKRGKYGSVVDAISVEDKDYGLFVFTNNHWAYGEQIEPLNNSDNE